MSQKCAGSDASYNLKIVNKLISCMIFCNLQFCALNWLIFSSSIGQTTLMMPSRNPRSVSLMRSMCSISMKTSRVVCEAHFDSFLNWMNAFWGSWHSLGPKGARGVWVIFKSHSQLPPVFYVEVACLTGTLCPSSHQQWAPQTDSTAASWILQIKVI